jgi:hypothetical protein
MQFYVNDWLSDDAVRASSPEARALWMDMLCFMQNSPKRGYLLTKAGKPYGVDQIARMAGFQPQRAKVLLDELKDNGVYSETEEGVIYNRRMVRQEKLSGVRSEAANARWSKEVASGFAMQTDMQDPMQASDVTSDVRIQKTESETAAASAYANTPLAAAAITERFPSADREICDRIITAAWKEYPQIEDWQLADAIKSATKRDQRSPALYLKTVPAIIANWRKQADADAGKQAARDAYNLRLIEENAAAEQLRQLARKEIA